ncbi:MAG: MarR family transcriptional regulator [Flavobacteriales bacterium]|nr:MarR family transcriptional regulator [Flavobacteriales bacterium]
MKKGMFPGLEKLMMPWIGKTMKHIDLFIATKLSERGISLTRQQVILLKILYHDGPLPQNDLAFLTDRDKTSLTRLLSTMEKKNLVARITSPEDKRVNMVHLTKHGEKVVNETMPVLFETILHMQEGITQEEQETVIAVMKKIQENVGKHIDSCSINK